MVPLSFQESASLPRRPGTPENSREKQRRGRMRREATVGNVGPAHRLLELSLHGIRSAGFGLELLAKLGNHVGKLRLHRVRSIALLLLLTLQSEHVLIVLLGETGLRGKGEKSVARPESASRFSLCSRARAVVQERTPTAHSGSASVWVGPWYIVCRLGCRSNGNISLLGHCRVPTESRPSSLFYDDPGRLYTTLNHQITW